MLRIWGGGERRIFEGVYCQNITPSNAVLVSNHSPNGVEQLSNLSSNVPSKDESGP